MPFSFNYIVSGHVQGVFFRAFTKRAADSYSIRGYVKNDHLGTVSGVAQGEYDALDKFKEAIGQGPRHAHVREVKITKETEIARYDYLDFNIE